MVSRQIRDWLPKLALLPKVGTFTLPNRPLGFDDGRNGPNPKTPDRLTASSVALIRRLTHTQSNLL